MEPQKRCLRICLVYVLLGDTEKKDDFMPGDRTEITAVSVQHWRHFQCSILKMKAKYASGTVVSFNRQKWRHIPQQGSLYNQLTDIPRIPITNTSDPVFIQAQQIHRFDGPRKATHFERNGFGLSVSNVDVILLWGPRMRRENVWSLHRIVKEVAFGLHSNISRSHYNMHFWSYIQTT